MFCGEQTFESSELFWGAYHTRENYPVLIGGVCAPGQAEVCRQAFSKMASVDFGQSGDCVVIDALLAQYLRALMPPDVTFLAASIHVPHARGLCGAVAGPTSVEESSADGALYELGPKAYGFALPGAGAAFVHDSNAIARRVYNLAKQKLTDLPLVRAQIASFLEEATALAEQLLFVTDGSGGSEGCLCIHTNGHTSLRWLMESGSYV